ncbi:predicted protein [Verticillium alfalfae VaMs.102]|uniref:Predicted protein n=1 Tax=Verticillium alfalfae (strain VaMs.102 / ATCC MYA-4576 / FGSC 10136) TaxID=526221 RepID=C9SSA5_VERA1|nr:predicted protein [Verticillium alfalfae VaMs.102]EEY21670.1 predicted protein [Verticillium alfalfae VaMs.102]
MCLSKCDDPADERFFINITLRWCKDNKDKPENNLICTVNELDNTDYNVVDLVKLLIAWALRSEAVYANTFEDLITTCRGHPKRLVIWRHPNRAIFPAAGKAGDVLLDGNMEYRQPLALLRKSCITAGLAIHPVTHDVRRGAIRGVFEIGRGLGIDSGRELARQVAGHSLSSFAAGVTDEYIGPSHIDHYSLRINAHTSNQSRNNTNEKKRALPYDLESNLTWSEGQTSSKRKHSRQEITDTCQSMGLDPKVVRHRETASKKLNSTQHWAAAINERQEQDAMDALTAHAPPGKQINEASEGTEKGKSSSITNPRNPFTHPKSFDSCNLIDIPQDGPVSSAARSEADIINDSLEDIIIQADDDAEQDATEQDALDAMPEIPLESDSVLTSDRKQFVTYFSSVNTYLHQTATSKSPAIMPTTIGSKDLPDRKVFACRNKFCSRVFNRSAAFEQHLKTCDPPKNDALVCTNCSKLFKTEKSLKGHLDQKICDFGQKLCPYRHECGDDTVFTGRGTLEKHYDDKHRGWVNRNCPVRSCPRHTQTFNKITDLKGHLKRMHKDILTDDAIADWLPTPRGRINENKNSRTNIKKSLEKCAEKSTKKSTETTVANDSDEDRIVYDTGAEGETESEGSFSTMTETEDEDDHENDWSD